MEIMDGKFAGERLFAPVLNLLPGKVRVKHVDHDSVIRAEASCPQGKLK